MTSLYEYMQEESLAILRAAEKLNNTDVEHDSSLTLSSLTDSLQYQEYLSLFW